MIDRQLHTDFDFPLAIPDEPTYTPDSVPGKRSCSCRPIHSVHALGPAAVQAHSSVWFCFLRPWSPARPAIAEPAQRRVAMPLETLIDSGWSEKTSRATIGNHHETTHFKSTP
jgi:hypothetical protein